MRGCPRGSGNGGNAPSTSCCGSPRRSYGSRRGKGWAGWAARQDRPATTRHHDTPGDSTLSFSVVLLQRYRRMLLWEYLWWTDIIVPLDPINWESSPEATVRIAKRCALFKWVLRCSVTGLISVQERQRACDEAMLTMAQGVDKARPAKVDRAHIIQTMHQGLATRAHLDPVGSWMLPVAGRVAAKNGSWFRSRSGLNCHCHSSALLLPTSPGHGRTVLLHTTISRRRRAAALRAGGLAMKSSRPPKRQEILRLVFLRTRESQNAWRCFAQTIFITVICVSCSSARCRSEICKSAEDAGRSQAVQPRRSKKARGQGTHTRRTGMWTHCGSSSARGSLKGCNKVRPRLRRMWWSTAWS